MQTRTRWLKRLGLVLACVLPGVVIGFIAGAEFRTRQFYRSIQHIHAWDARGMVWALEKLRDGQMDGAIKILEGQVTTKVRIAQQWDLPFDKGTRDMILQDTMESLQAVRLYFNKTGDQGTADGLLPDVPLPEHPGRYGKVTDG